MTYFDLTTRDMGSVFRYGFRKVLSTQNRPTLRLAPFIVSYVIISLKVSQPKSMELEFRYMTN